MTHRTWTPAIGLLLVMSVIGVAGLVLLDHHPLAAQSAADDYVNRPPRQCRRCHADEYRDWLNSAHGLAYEAEAFQSVWARSRQKPECLTCHSPGYDPATEQMAYQGVGCAACHQTLETTRRQGDGRTYHGRLSLGSAAAVCGTCHGADHARTFIEWQDSPHNGARTVTCLDCHRAHTNDLTAATPLELCGRCHLQEVPTTNPHMHVDGNCTDCHPAPVNTNNVHLHGGAEADCTACHMTTEPDQYGRYLMNAGHTMTVSLAACTGCHGKLHDLTAGAP